jgi:uncharacterized membrane protein
MAHNILVITWADDAKAFKALFDLRASSSGKVNQAVVAERLENGTLVLRDGDAAPAEWGALGGGALGSILGIIGGPLGVLLGFTTGALFGSLADADHAVDDETVLAKMSAAIRPGSTALVVDLDETDTSVVDQLVSASGGKLVRQSYDEVYAEVVYAEDALDAAASAAAEKLRQERKADRKAEHEKKWAETKAKFKSFFKSGD